PILRLPDLQILSSSALARHFWLREQVRVSGVSQREVNLHLNQVPQARQVLAVSGSSLFQMSPHFCHLLKHRRKAERNHGNLPEDLVDNIVERQSGLAGGKTQYLITRGALRIEAAHAFLLKRFYPKPANPGLRRVDRNQF